MTHPEVENCAVIAVPHEKWYERPLLIVVPKAGCMPESKNLLEYLEGSFAKWQLPDGVVYEEELPFTATGKVSKLSLRKKYEDFNFKKGKNIKCSDYLIVSASRDFFILSLNFSGCFFLKL